MTPIVTVFAHGPLVAAAEFSVGTQSVPYLADHGFHDMAVLPGSFYVEMTRFLEQRLIGRAPRVMRNLTFHNPVVLSATNVVVRMEVQDRGDGCMQYTFHEAGTELHAATLEVDRNAPWSSDTTDAHLRADKFQARAEALLTRAEFYERLGQNGNLYGPEFRTVRSVWRVGNESLGMVSVAALDAHTAPFSLHPSVLDSIVQLLVPFVIDTGKTFILRSIDRLEIVEDHFPELLWGHATRPDNGAEQDGVATAGNVRAFDQTGKTFIAISGVHYSLLDRAAEENGPTATRLVIASNFTAEPVEESLQFWGDHFGTRLQIDFAPYNQLFQQLLDADSSLSKNHDGVNAILLRLEEWAAAKQRGHLQFSQDQAERSFAERPRYTLPNGLEIVQLNQYETDYVFKEIFEDRCYLRHGIRLKDGATVVDIGANIGLFSLFVLTECRNPKIFAFEPAPPVYELLKVNCEAYGSDVHVVNAGVSNEPKTATFTFYDKSSVFSSFHADEVADRAAIQAIVRNTVSAATSAEGDTVHEFVEELTAGRLHRTTHECRLTTVSDIIREHAIDTIDLLKIDAEKSELDIIRGIADEDWAKIAQLVLEIHDPTEESVRQLETMLTDKGFRCAVEHERLLEHSGLFNLYATRDNAVAEAEPAPALQQTTHDFATALRAFAAQSPSPLVLGLCPTSPSASADRALETALRRAELALLTAADAIPNVHTIPSASALDRYPVRDYFDVHSYQAGHVPYSPEGYAAIGTALVRTIAGLKRKPFKAIALDCDNTLWKGVCGEDGALGIELSEPHRRLQEFMLEQMKAGMLLCLCSKNNEQDVLDVFSQRADMVLKLEHFVDRRINWNNKSDNVRALASDLKLGLDSFIFIDDNPIECADLRFHCPEVLTLELPRESSRIPSFLDHVWAFDHAKLTDEDRNRSRSYQAAVERQRFHETTLSLSDFIKGLQLQIEITEATDEQLNRVAQLTLRTNQFNFTTIRRSEAEVRQFLRRDGAGCLAVHVSDRFGDYGLVGAVLFESLADRLKVDSLLLSCRVLGKGVEHALVARLGRRASAEHKPVVELAFRPTDKNAPAEEFLRSLSQDFTASAVSIALSADQLAALEYNPDATRAPKSPTLASDSTTERRESADSSGFNERSRALQTIAEHLYDSARLSRAIEDFRLRKQPVNDLLAATPADGLEAVLLAIWRRVLGNKRIGVNDNFFEAGGTSLKAVQVVASIKKETTRSLSIVTLFECPTVVLLAARLGNGLNEQDGDNGAAGAALRGQKRRNVRRRKAS